MKVAYCFTTIYDPTDFILSHLRNLRRWGHNSLDVTFIIMGDLMTPPHVSENIDHLRKAEGASCIYLDAGSQERWVEATYPELQKYIPGIVL